MLPPSTRLEFEHNVYLSVSDALRRIEMDRIDAGFVHMTLPRIKALRYLPNRRIDLNTVDEQLRLQANMLNWMEHMEKPKFINGEPEDK